MIKETTVERQVVIDAPAATIWKELDLQGLSSLHLLRQEGPKELKEGTTLEWHALEEAPTDLPKVTGRVVVFSPPRRIVYMAFMPGIGMEDVPENYTSVDLRLEEVDEGRTLVSVTHGDFAQHPHGVRRATQAGNAWVEALIRLKQRVERELAA